MRRCRPNSATPKYSSPQRWTSPAKKRPAVGADADPAVLERVIDGLGAAAAAITAEGVRPVVHPHVGSRIEVEDEVHAVLAGIEDSILGFGPDTGHLTWAGMDAVKIMTQYADRIGAMHLKDVHIDQAAAAKSAGASYHESTREVLHGVDRTRPW